MNPIISNLVFPIFGIAIVIFCILCFFFPFGQKFRDKTQKIRGFGVDLEISILTLVILIGVVFSFTGIYLQIKDYKKQIDSIKEDVNEANTKLGQANTALEQERKREITLVVTLEDVRADNMPELVDLKCTYLLVGSNNSLPADVMRGIADATLKIHIKDIKTDTYIQQLELVDQKSGRKWVTDKGFIPFEPELHLIRKE